MGIIFYLTLIPFVMIDPDDFSQHLADQGRGIYSYVPYALITIFLLGFRLINWLGILRRSLKDDELEVKARK